MSYRFVLLLLATWTCWSNLPGRTEARSHLLLSASGDVVQLAQADTDESGTTPGAILQIGSEGPAVSAIQRKLAELGYYDGEETGLYDQATAAAVEQFQTVAELPATGAIDLATWEQIQAAGPSLAAPEDERDEAAAEDGTADPSAADDGTGNGAEDSEASGTPEASANTDGAPFGLDGLPRLALLGVVGLIGCVAIAGMVMFVLKQFSKFTTASAPAPPKPEPSPPLSTSSVTGDTNGAGASPVSSPPVSPPPVSPPPQTVESAPPAQSQPEAESPPATHNQTHNQAHYQTPNPTHSQSHSNGTSSAIHPANVGHTTRLSKASLIDALIADLDSLDPEVRRKAIWELGQRGTTQAIQPLVNLLMSSDSQQRSLILAALSEIGNRTFHPMQRALAISLQDDSADVRKNAIRDLTRIYDYAVQLAPLLNHAVDDPDPEVRETANWALNQLKQLRFSSLPSPDKNPLLDSPRPPHDGSDPRS